MKAHPDADLVPLLEGAELAALAADIKEHGLRLPIVTHLGRVLDGRNRLAACELAGVPPRFEVWAGTGSPTAWVLSVNLHRRHLDASQRAMVGGRARDQFETETRAREHARKTGTTPAILPESYGESRDKAAALVNVSGRSVEAASRVLAKGSADLVRAVDRGQVTVSDAAKVLDQSKAAQSEHLRAVQAGEAKTLAAAARASAREALGMNAEPPGDKSLAKFANAMKRLAALGPEVTALASTVAALWEETGVEVSPSLSSNSVFIQITAMRDSLSRVVGLATKGNHKRNNP